jgi:excisionase family DNA binding protein
MPASNGRYLTAQGVADILHCSAKTVSRWANEGKLPYQRTLGGHRRFSEQRIREIAARLVFTPAEEGEPEEATA